MRIKSITLERFRQFQRSTIHFGEYNVIVGPNNSGKTTVLHGIRAFFSLMKGHVRFEGNPPKPTYHRRFLSSAEEVVPTPDQRELWYGKKAGSGCKITVEFSDETAFSVVLRQQFGQVHVSTENLPTLTSVAQVRRYLDMTVAFIPGLVGVLVSEPYATLARRNSLASQGRYSEIFRSSLHQLKERDADADADAGLLRKLNATLHDLFGLEVTKIAFNPDTDEYVTVLYKQGTAEYDVVSSGSGLQQVIQILTYLYLSNPQILLIDEPDAHLHSQLQGRLGTLFRRAATDLNAQVFLSTHSMDLVDTANPSEVIVIDSKKNDIRALGENADVVGALVGAGIVENSSLSRIIASRRMVIIEDEDISLYKLLDRVTGAGLFGSASGAYVKSAKGCSNFPQYVVLADVIESFSGSPLDLVFLQDRDGLPDFMVQDFLKSMQRERMDVHLLDRHELESYLINPELICAALKDAITEADVQGAILEAAKQIRQEARQKCRETAKLVNRHFSPSKKIKPRELEQKTDAWFDELDDTDWGTVARVWPGKETLKIIRQVLRSRHGLELREGTLRTAMEPRHLPDDFVDFWKGLASQDTRARRRRGRSTGRKPAKKTT